MASRVSSLSISASVCGLTAIARISWAVSNKLRRTDDEYITVSSIISRLLSILGVWPFETY